MARFITVTVGCDWRDCDQIAPEGEDLITELTVALDGKQSRSFMLCKNHREDLDEVLLPLMQKGVKVEAPAKPQRAPKPTRTGTSRKPTPPEPGTPEADSLICQVKGCSRHGRPVMNRTGMAQHVIRAHGYADLAAYEADHGTVGTPPS